MEENQIKTLTVTEFLGKNFFIPEYQRGYRWTKTNVLQLLNNQTVHLPTPISVLNIFIGPTP